MSACGPAGDEAAEATLQDRVRTSEGVTLTATTALLASYPVRIRASVTATNESGRPATLRFADDCPVVVRALDTDGQTRWDQGALLSCNGEATQVSLSAGESVVFETEASAMEILGDSLPDAVYVVAAQLRPEGEGPVLLRAGRANLVVPR